MADSEFDRWQDDLDVEVPEFRFPSRPQHGGFPDQERYAGVTTSLDRLHAIIPSNEARAILKAAEAAEDEMPEIAECYRAVAGYDGITPLAPYDWEQDGGVE